MKKNLYILGGKSFRTKKEIISACKDVLNGNFGELEGEDLNLMLDVLKMHPRYKEKVGNNKYTIMVVVCPINPVNNQFNILFDNGAVEDFSYYKAVKGYSTETKLKETLRQVIDPFHKAYRRTYIRQNLKGKYLFCEETGLKMLENEAHLDHYPKQFEEIVCDWMKINGYTLSKIKLIPPSGYGFTWNFEDISIGKSFIEHHNSVVEYRMVLNKVNLQRCKSKTKLPK